MNVAYMLKWKVSLMPILCNNTKVRKSVRIVPGLPYTPHTKDTSPQLSTQSQGTAQTGQIA